jgi:hypothetical protein
MAETVSYKAGDVIVDFQSVRNMDGVLYGTFAHGKAALTLDANQPAGQVGTIFIANVITATFETSKTDIVLRLKFYSPPTVYTVWECVGEYEESDQSSEICNQIKKMQDNIAELDAESIEFVTDLFYPWKKSQAKPNSAREYDLVNLSKQSELPKYLCLDYRPGMFSGKVYGYDDDIFPGDYLPKVGTSSFNVVIALLSEYLKNLNVLYTAATTFNREKRNLTSQFMIFHTIKNMKL